LPILRGRSGTDPRSDGEEGPQKPTGHITDKSVGVADVPRDLVPN
jgi:hypothetical protein